MENRTEGVTDRSASFNSWNNMEINNAFYEHMEVKTGMSNT